MIPLARTSDHDTAVEYGLRAVERGLVHERLEVALRRDSVVRALDLAGIDRIPHHLAEALRRDRQTLPAAQAGCSGACDHFLLGVLARRQILERLAHQRRAFRIVHKTRGGPLRRVQVAERRRKRPAPEFERGLHASACSIRAHVVVELRERGQHAFHQLAGGRVVDRFGRRPQRDAQRIQMCAQRKVVVLLPREPREVVHDDEMDLALVRSAVLQQRLQLAADRRLGALALFVEALADLVAVPAAVLLAGAELRGQTEVLGLFLRADANVDHRADHLGQLSPVSGRRQGLSSRHAVS
ncbi:MAG TPA: hypothetical protein VF198_12365 [Vicinamibacterales bacterium]